MVVTLSLIIKVGGFGAAGWLLSVAVLLEGVCTIRLSLLEANHPSIMRRDGGIERSSRRRLNGGRDLALGRERFLSWKMGSKTWRIDGVIG
jgi:hypothetical protein